MKKKELNQTSFIQINENRYEELIRQLYLISKQDSKDFRYIFALFLIWWRSWSCKSELQALTWLHMRHMICQIHKSDSKSQQWRFTLAPTIKLLMVELICHMVEVHYQKIHQDIHQKMPSHIKSNAVGTCLILLMNWEVRIVLTSENVILKMFWNLITNRN